MPRDSFFSLSDRERRRSRSDVQLLAGLGARDRVHFVVERPDGTRNLGEMPPTFLALLRFVAERLMGGIKVAVAEEDAEVSPEVAAEILGYSRPLVVRRMDAGKLPFRYVGAHRRCTLRDVIELRDRERAAREAQAELAEATEELISKHGL
jgi:hypothetical protein